MEQDFVIRLTFATHRVANTLPSHIKTPLQETANSILRNSVLFSDAQVLQKGMFKEQILADIEKLFWYVGHAKEAGLANPANFTVLQKEYQKVKAHVESFKQEEPVPFVMPVQPAVPEQRQGEKQEEKQNINIPDLSDRQRKIVELLKGKEKAQVWELQKVFPSVTKRTLRRDLDSLLQQDLIERQGEWNTVFYRIKGLSRVS